MVAVWRIAAGGSHGSRQNRLAPSGENSRELLPRSLTIPGGGGCKRFEEIATASAAREIDSGRGDRNDPLARLAGIRRACKGCAPVRGEFEAEGATPRPSFPRPLPPGDG